MSIATKSGDGGRTSLGGGSRVSKADLRVEAYGAIDELIAQMGLARSLCEVEEARALTRDVQRELFAVCAALADERGGSPVGAAAVEALTAHVHRLEAREGMVADWALPGDHAAGAAFDVARTTCRRAERAAVRLRESGEALDARVVPYLNRLSDLLWLLGRLVEADAGVRSVLRDETQGGPRWSKAW